MTDREAPRRERGEAVEWPRGLQRVIVESICRCRAVRSKKRFCCRVRRPLFFRLSLSLSLSLSLPLFRSCSLVALLFVGLWLAALVRRSWLRWVGVMLFQCFLDPKLSPISSSSTRPMLHSFLSSLLLFLTLVRRSLVEEMLCIVRSSLPFMLSYLVCLSLS